ncbi:hypothetical protein HPB49_009035 [Dermacentor silvarum]|uniref:Uncharacterized protein n=1 Tax=Dermacentor silvarum TaxID=543639 RepID=A0ACB8CK40_DERSI|nr:hypothetical protein HPB49_009035 [Dermacentor silvarum]
MDHGSPPAVGGAAAPPLGLTQQLAANRHSIRNKLDHDGPRGPYLCLSMILKSSCAQEMVARSEQEVDELHLRVQVAQNTALISTPSEIIATNLNKMASLKLGPHRYPISAYIASPDNSCKGIITGRDAATTPTELLDYLLAPGVEILHARMMGRTATAIITFAGLKVPRYVRYYGAEYRCYIHAPRAQVCGICLTVGHRADICPTPSIKRCTTCGTENPSSTEPHQCQPRCLTCKGGHPTTDPSCPNRARKPPNKKRVRRELEKQKRQQNHHRTQSRERRSRSRSPSRSPSRSQSPSRGPADSSKNSERRQPSSSSSPPSSPPPAKKKPPPLPQQLPSAASGGPAGPKGVSWAEVPPPSLRKSPSPSSEPHSLPQPQSHQQASRIKIPPESVTAMCRDLQHELRRDLHQAIQEMQASILTEVKEMIRAAFVDFQTMVLKPMLHEITNELKQSVRELTAQPLLSKSSSSS